MKPLALCLLMLAALLFGSACWVASPGPSQPELYTSTTEVTAMAWHGDTLWVATRGGVLRWRPGERHARKFTMLDALPDNEVRSLTVSPGGDIYAATLDSVSVFTDEAFHTFHRFAGEEVRFLLAAQGSLWVGTSGHLRQWTGKEMIERCAGAIGVLVLDGHRLVAIGHERWLEVARDRVASHALPENFGRPLAAAATTQHVLVSTTEGLWRLVSRGWDPVSLPPGELGSHVSAIAPWDNGVLCASFGGRLWRHGSHWTALREVAVGSLGKDVTSLAVTAGWAAAGTLGGGAYVTRLQGNRQVWRHVGTPPEPPSQNVYAAAALGGKVWFSTFTEGLMAWERGTWTRPLQNAPKAPRHIAIFRGRLFLREANGAVGVGEGGVWKRDVWPFLPRKWTSALACDDCRIYVGVWGGWSECDGERWTHHLKHSELAGLVVTCIAADGDNLWLGTQARGVFRFNRKSQSFQVFDQRSGLPDDWIVDIAVERDVALVGTFSGGAAKIAEGRVGSIPGLPRAVTAVRSLGRGRWAIGTRQGLFVWNPRNSPEVTSVTVLGSSEVQCLLLSGQELWVGARTGLWRLPVL